MDDIDRANDYAEQMREQALAEHFRKTGLRHDLLPSTLACSDCGGAIPEARLRAMPTAERCIGCQIEHEMEESRRRI